MAKRYHQSKKSRHKEHMGMERYERGPVKMHGSYEGHADRRRQEMEDAGMIHEDHNAVANLPQDVKYHPWPGAYQGVDAKLDDTIHGINRQIDEDESGARRHLGVHKW